MKKKLVTMIPALCFLVGFLVCTLFIPADSQILADGDTYFADACNVSFWDIFLNNTFMCLIFILGCGVGSSVLLLIQGFSFGATYVVWILMGNTTANFLLLFLPHVIFEFIAMAMAGYLGFQLFYFITNKTGQTVKDLIRSNKYILAGTFGTVLVAALIECYVTPYLYTIA